MRRCILFLGIMAICSFLKAYANETSNNAPQLETTPPPAEGILRPEQTPPLLLQKTSAKPDTNNK